MSYGKRRRKKKNYAGPIIFYLLLIFLAVGGIVYLVKTDVFSGNPFTKVQSAVTRQVTETAIEKVIQNQTGTDVSISEIKAQMTEEDADKLDTIVDKYATSDNITKAAETAISGDKEAMKEFIAENVDSADMDSIQELYDKYKDQIPTE